MPAIAGRMSKLTMLAYVDPKKAKAQILAACDGAKGASDRMGAAARALGVSRPTFYRLVRMLKLERILPGRGQYDREKP